MNSRFCHWADVRVFLAVLREGSTLAASRSLGMAQPTVARRIDALEHELGLMLFHRDTRGFRPTNTALELQKDAEALECAALSFAETASVLARPRPIRITAHAPNLEGHTTLIFNDFAELHPEVTFEFLTGLRVFDLMGGEADIGLRLAWSPPDPDLISRHISNARFAIYASPDYAKAHGIPKSPQELAHHKVLGFLRSDVPPILLNWINKYVDDAKIIRTYSETGLLDGAIRAGHGVGIVNCKLAEKDVNAGRLIQCFDAPAELTVPHLLLVAPDAWKRPEVKTFVKFFAPRYKKLFT